MGGIPLTTGTNGERRVGEKPCKDCMVSSTWPGRGTEDPVAAGKLSPLHAASSPSGRQVSSAQGFTVLRMTDLPYPQDRCQGAISRPPADPDRLSLSHPLRLTLPMPVRTDLTDALLALIPEDGRRVSNDEIREALEREAEEPFSEADLEEAKSHVVAMGAAEKARGPGGGLKKPGARAPARATGRKPGNGRGRAERNEGAEPVPVQPPTLEEAARGFQGWVAPPERDLGKAAMEKSLWEAADQFRANSGLKAQEYSGPILGLIFLRFADARFMPRWNALKEAGGSERRPSREEDPNAYQSEGLLYLPPGSRYQELLELPEGADVGARLNEAMGLIEQHNSKLAGVLPRTYGSFSPQLLKELLKRISEIPTDLEFDAFGRIYEYFLGEFARSEGQKGGRVLHAVGAGGADHRDRGALRWAPAGPGLRFGWHVCAECPLREGAPRQPRRRPGDRRCGEDRRNRAAVPHEPGDSWLGGPDLPRRRQQQLLRGSA